MGRGQPAIIISNHRKVIISACETGYQYRQMNVSGVTKHTTEPERRTVIPTL